MVKATQTAKHKRAPKSGFKKAGAKPAPKKAAHKKTAPKKTATNKAAKKFDAKTEPAKKRFYKGPKTEAQQAKDAKRRAKDQAAKKLAKRPYSDVAKLEAKPGSKPAVKPSLKPSTKPQPKVQRPYGLPEQLRDAALKVLDERQAEDILTLDLTGRSSLADYIIIASGRAARQIGAIAHYLREAFDKLGVKPVRSEGLPQGDWVLVDGGDVIVHLFRPEVRAYYNIETIWAAEQ